MKRLALVLAGAVILAACTQGPAAAPNTPAAGATPGATTPAGAPARPADTAQTGRILAIKSGDIVQIERGALKTLAGGARYQSLAFAPDAAEVAASILGDNHSDLVVLDSLGKRLRQLTDNWSKTDLRNSAWARHPSWSPDGHSIAFVADNAGGPLSLWVADSSSGNKRQLLASPSLGGLDWPSWSPSGQEIAATAFDAKTSQIISVNVASGGYKALTEQAEGAYDPAWSPDGSRIAFAARAGGRSDIWVMDKTGANAQRVTDVGAARAPAWSPSGDLIAFLADRGTDFDLFAVRPTAAQSQPVPASQLQRLTDGQHLEASSGLSWSR